MTTKAISKKAQAQLDRDYSVNLLLTHYIKENSKIYTSLRKVSSSGMTQHYSLFIAQGSEIINVTYYSAHALGWRLTDTNGHRAIVVNGTGMDMGYHLVSSLSSVLFAGQDRAWDKLKVESL